MNHCTSMGHGNPGMLRVRNIHERAFPVSPDRVGVLLDSLASRDDLLWPSGVWPRMKLDRPLSVGARGGHGPIRYTVEAYTPGRSVRFRLLGPKGFDGYHSFDILETADHTTLLRHTLEMTPRGRAMVTWPLVFRPLHDALVEDSLAHAGASLGCTARVRRWSSWVRLLRWALSSRHG